MLLAPRGGACVPQEGEPEPEPEPEPEFGRDLVPDLILRMRLRLG